jgi:hypothetical protein
MKSNDVFGHQFLQYCPSVHNIITKRRKLRIDEEGNLIHRSVDLLNMKPIFFYYCYMDKGCKVQSLFGQSLRPFSTSSLPFPLVFFFPLQSNFIYNSLRFYHSILWTLVNYPNPFLLVLGIPYDEIDKA